VGWLLALRIAEAGDRSDDGVGIVMMNNSSAHPVGLNLKTVANLRRRMLTDFVFGVGSYLVAIQLS